MTRDVATKDELLRALAGLRRATVAGRRAPHKPLLLLWLLGRFAATGSTAVAYGEAEEPVGRMIDDYGPPALSSDRAAMPFVHLERALWDPRDADGRPVPASAPERGSWLRARGATGRLRAPVERLLADPGTLAASARLLLDLHFTPALAPAIRADAGLDLTVAEGAALTLVARRRRPRRPEFAGQVLHAYARTCAMCGYDGALGRHPVALEAAHVRWHSQDGPDEPSNGLALCALHHALLDLGALGLTPDLRIRVSPPLHRPRPGGPGRRRARRRAAGQTPSRTAAGGPRLRRVARPPGLQARRPRGHRLNRRGHGGGGGGHACDAPERVRRPTAQEIDGGRGRPRTPRSRGGRHDHSRGEPAEDREDRPGRLRRAGPGVRPPRRGGQQGPRERWTAAGGRHERGRRGP
ncbi:hypothetical protein LJ221_17845 [Streptomyces sp. CNQ085]|nr:HNH endonuclease [Streptomyces sp. CNQ085]MCI0386128.1 hypothetical protein [Streptomyces sp. CNQ085]